VSELVVAITPDIASAPPAYLRSGVKPLRTVAGGPRRQDSVTNAFRAASPSSDVIVVHDAARPFVTAGLIGRTIAAAAEFGAALAAVPARDTVKQVRMQQVEATLARGSIYLAQTPQAFRRQVLADALAMSGDATDEAELAARAGHAVHIVDGDASNIKITTAEDLAIARAIASCEASETGRRPGSPAAGGARVGVGHDVHRLVEGRPLILGGIEVPAARGALGHSDADVICHAVTDAMLGAASLGDIGSHFPDSDPRWKDARSLDLLRHAAAMTVACGFAVGNIDVTVLLETPKLRGHIDRIRESLASALHVAIDRVSIKAKTNEGLDAIGRGEAIAAHAIALLHR
jgi:2-C-methyl-D-erythritol 4-phosphate cytidylyltransferase/2-C-methyl-D-erythritol 2,4-cyclodiphosphate synthase